MIDAPEPLDPDPYLPPGIAPEPPLRKRALPHPALLLATAVLVYALTCVAMSFTADGLTSLVAYGGFGSAALLGLLAGVSGGHAAVITGGLSRLGFAGSAILGLFMTGLGLLSAVISTMQFTRGRQLRRFGRVLLPRVERGADWAARGDAVAIPESTRAALAAQWRENGRTEHASVAAFARLTLDLMALGAPPGLIAAANRDALDEIRHAEACFALARAIDGRAEGPAAFPEASRARTLPSARTLALAQLAVDSLVDGALHEGVSARIVARLAKRCEVGAIRDVLKGIAADEGRHAAHGWDVVQWCVAEGGAPVAHALRGAVRALPAVMESPLPEGAKGGGWERFGIHGHALEADESAKARADLVARVESLAVARAA